MEQVCAKLSLQEQVNVIWLSKVIKDINILKLQTGISLLDIHNILKNQKTVLGLWRNKCVNKRDISYYIQTDDWNGLDALLIEWISHYKMNKTELPFSAINQQVLRLKEYFQIPSYQIRHKIWSSKLSQVKPKKKISSKPTIIQDPIEIFLSYGKRLLKRHTYHKFLHEHKLRISKSINNDKCREEESNKSISIDDNEDIICIENPIESINICTDHETMVLYPHCSLEVMEGISIDKCREEESNKSISIEDNEDIICIENPIESTNICNDDHDGEDVTHFNIRCKDYNETLVQNSVDSQSANNDFSAISMTDFPLIKTIEIEPESEYTENIKIKEEPHDDISNNINVDKKFIKNEIDDEFLECDSDAEEFIECEETELTTLTNPPIEQYLKNIEETKQNTFENANNEKENIEIENSTQVTKDLVDKNNVANLNGEIGSEKVQHIVETLNNDKNENEESQVVFEVDDSDDEFKDVLLELINKYKHESFEKNTKNDENGIETQPTDEDAEEEVLEIEIISDENTINGGKDIKLNVSDEDIEVEKEIKTEPTDEDTEEEEVMEIEIIPDENTINGGKDIKLNVSDEDIEENITELEIISDEENDNDKTNSKDNVSILRDLITILEDTPSLKTQKRSKDDNDDDTILSTSSSLTSEISNGTKVSLLEDS